MHIIKNNIFIDENGCWIWKKSKTSSGYGQITVNGVYWSSHVYAYCKSNNCNKQKGMHIRHLCHNKLCCNPEHLLKGTPRDNWNDSKELHLKASMKRRKTWIVYGKTYDTCRSAVKETGISMNSIIKYTKNSVFDSDEYEKGCIKGKRV